MATMLAHAASPRDGGDLLDASIRALLLFDSEAQVIAIRELLSASRRETYYIEWGEPFDAGPDLLRDGVHDVCLLSCQSAEDELRVLRETESVARRAPIVVLTAASDQATEAAAMAAGATDSLDWDIIDTDRLDRTLRSAVERNRLVRHLGDALIQVAALRRSLARTAPDVGAG